MTLPTHLARALLTIVLSAVGVAAQNGPQPEARDSTTVDFPADPTAARAPFGPGERLVYSVKVGPFGVGRGEMSVLGLDSVRGRPTYRASLRIEGGLGPARVDDETTSWFDRSTFSSLRFIQDIDEVNYESYRHYELYPEERRWERQDNDEFGELGSSLPLDDVSFIYYIRTMRLQVGRTYTLSRYFKPDGNPVVIQVLRKDERETPAGTFRTLVVKPLIRTRGLFSQGGDAELHFTDDDRRILVYLKSNIPKFPGSLTLHLQEIHEGLPLNPTSRARALARRADSGGDAVPQR